MTYPTKYFLAAFAVDGDAVTSPPNAVQVSGSISYEQGYGPDYQLDPVTNPSALDIDRATTNGLYNDITGAIQWFQQNGVAYWIDATTNGGSAFPYALNAIVLYTDGNVYQSLAAANTVTPGTDPTKWQIIGAIGQQTQAGNYAVDTGAADAIAITLNPAPASLVALEGAPIRIKVAHPNATTTPQVTIDPFAAMTITNPDGSVLFPGQIAGGAVITVVTANGTTAQLVSGGINAAVAGNGVGGTRRNLNINVTGNATIAGTASELVLDNVTLANAPQRITAATFAINTGTTGAGGIDVGTVAANQPYDLYVGFNPSGGGTVAAWLTIEGTATTPPSGYSFFQKVGWVVTDGSSHLKVTKQVNDEGWYVVGSGGALPQLASGIAGNVSTPTWVAKALAGLVPVAAISAAFICFGTQSNVLMLLAPNGNYPRQDASGGFIESSGISQEVEIYLESGSVYYASNDSGAWVAVYRWKLNI